MKGILDSWGVDPFYLFVVMFIIQIVMIVLYVMLNTKYRRLQKSYVTFMRGKNGKNLEKSIFGKFDELDEIAELVRANEKEVKEISEKMKTHYQKVGIVKYDAFHEMGGELSFALTMLDENNKFNLPALKEKVDELLAKQDNLLYLLNTPAHNPTGYSLSGEDMDGVLAILKEAAVPGKNIVFFLDVAYIDYAGEKEEVRKIFKKLSGLPANILCIVGYSMSKGFTMYGQRTGAMIGVSSDKSVIDEFAAINQYTSRATWSNINRPAMRTLATIYSDPELLAKVCAERDYYYQMIKARADLFTKEAEECGLPMLPYVAGFFLSIPAKNPDAICEKLHEDNIFAVPLAAGVRIAVCAVPLKKIKGMAAKVNAAMQAVGE